MTVKKPIPALVAVLMTAAFFLVVLNHSFLRQLYDTVELRGLFEWLFVAAVVLAAFLILAAFFALFTGRHLFKPAITLFLLATSVVICWRAASELRPGKDSGR